MSTINDSRYNSASDAQESTAVAEQLADMDNPDEVITVVPKTSSQADPDERSPSTSTTTGDKDSTWTTTSFRFGPLAGIFGIFLALASLFASFGILVGSNGVAVSKWTIQPSALLAVFTAVGNQSMRFAAWQGVAVAWWIRASRSGSTIGRLHSDWRAGTTVRGAILSARHLSWLGLACVFSTIVAIDGPLLQRATDVTLVPIEGVTVNLEAHISPEIPEGFTGEWIEVPRNQIDHSALWGTQIPTSSGLVENDVVVIGSEEFLGDPSRGWMKGATLSGFIHGCEDNCTARVMAPAVVKTSCASHSVPVNYHHNFSVPLGEAEANFPVDSATILVDISLLTDGSESINLVTGFSQLSDCEGDFTWTACTLQSAIGLYDVLISNDKVTLLSSEPEIIAVANNTRVNAATTKLGGHISTLGGIVEILANYWNIVGAIGIINGAPIMLGYNLVIGEIFIKGGGGESCNVYDDPQPAVMKSINELMFRTGVFASSSTAAAGAHPVALEAGLSHSSNVTGYIKGLHNVYTTRFKWFVAAAIVEIVSIAMVLPTFYGWWKLGRSVSLSPLETAKAFDAPALSSCHSNSSAAGMAKALGDVPIRYGVAATTKGTTRLAFGDPELIEKPEKDSQFSV